MSELLLEKVEDLIFNKKLDTLRLFTIFNKKQVKLQMKNIHIILIGGTDRTEATTPMEMV